MTGLAQRWRWGGDRGSVIPAEAGTQEHGVGGEGAAISWLAVFLGPGLRRDDGFCRDGGTCAALEVGR